MGTFLPARLKKAREQMGLTQEAFARSLSVSSEFISLLEAGKRAPSLETLSRIAASVHRDPSFFLSEKEPAFTVLFRAASLDNQARAELDYFQRYVEDYLRLEEATGRRLEEAPLCTGHLSPERLATEERRRLGLGDEPIRDIFVLFERNGLRILRRVMPPEVQISGVFVHLEAQAASFALINASQTPCRQVFTAAHEYCHYLKHRHDGPLIHHQGIFYGELQTGVRRQKLAAKEQFAQKFAACFLMPPDKVRDGVAKESGSRRLSYDDVLLAKRYFGVSAQAMLRTLRDLNLLSATQFANFAALDPVSREHEVFGASEQECGPAGAIKTSSAVIVSDRYRLLEQEVKTRDEGKT